MAAGTGEFDGAFRAQLDSLMQWRRDVRRFRTDPIPASLLQECLDAFLLAPSVGLSEPWRVIQVNSGAARQAALSNYQAANERALEGYSGDKARMYAGLKLSGMQEAPVQLAVFCDEETPKGSGLGAQSMPEMRRYSVVSAINLFWLSARARGIGVGWVSILDPDALCRDLEVPENWRLIAYLCVGYPETTSDTPELQKVGWEERRGHLPFETR